MATLTTLLLAAAAAAALRPDGDPSAAKRAAAPEPPAIVVEGPPAPRWTIAPDPRLARRYAPAQMQARRGIVIRFRWTRPPTLIL